jgi:2-dehydro-3-deoxyphosphogluconate aldolase / (4S)-4-hydroxy-2-oxoglutarate aldolase
VLEVTLRTPAALDAIRAMGEVPGGIVGAGTLITPDDVRAAKAAGALFGVSPGFTPALLDACEAEELPLLGGTATLSEAMALLARGYDVAKFFPAEPNGGAAALKAFAGPLPQMAFCPTGGVNPRNAPDYLACRTCSASAAPGSATRASSPPERWDEIERLAREAAACVRAEEPLPVGGRNFDVGVRAGAGFKQTSAHGRRREGA